MNGKIIVLCFAVVLVGQSMSYAVLDREEMRKIGEHLGKLALFVPNNLNKLVGEPIHSGDAQNYIEKTKSSIFKSIANLESEAAKLKEFVRKSMDPNIVEKFDLIEKEIKTQTNGVKELFEEKVAKPINEKYREDMRIISDAILKITKDCELILYNAIDGIKKK